jgi:predicted permease
MINRVIGYISAVMRRKRIETEVDEELAFHLEKEIEANIERGLPPVEAKRIALRDLGGLTQTREAVRLARTAWLEEFTQDCRYGVRLLRRSPAFTAVAILSLALGIGATTAVFSVIDGLLLKTLPVSLPEQLVNFREHLPTARTNDLFAYDEFGRFRDQTSVFSVMAAISLLDRSNVTIEGESGGPDPGQVRVALVSGNYFSLLGVRALLGRALNPDDDLVPDGQTVAVISDDYWRGRLARTPDVVGRALVLNGTAYTILGVMPPGFAGDWVGRPADIWVPLMMESEVMAERPGLVTKHDDSSWLRVVARLKSGVTIQQAQAAARMVHQQQLKEWYGGAQASPKTIQDLAQPRLDLERAARGYSPQRESFTQSLAILTIVVGLALLVACSNVASLLLARAEARSRELALRLSLGASWARLIRQLVAENVLLTLIAGALGVLFATWATNALAASVARGPVPTYSLASSWVSFDLHVSERALVLTMSICLLTGLLFGLAPAFRGSRRSLTPSLMGRGADAERSAGRFRSGKLLVVGQVALSLVVLIGAGLFMRTLRNLEAQPLGYERSHLLLIWTQPGPTGRRGAALREFWHGVQEHISALPGVLSASAANSGLLNGSEAVNVGVPMRIEGEMPKPSQPAARIFVAPRFFETVGVPLVAGRDFNERDTASAPRVAIINESMARYYFGEQNPIGRRVVFPGEARDGPSEIVGVVKDFTIGTPRESGQKPETFFHPYRDPVATDPRIGGMCVVVRTAGDSRTLAHRVGQELRDLDPNLPVLKMDTIEEQLNDVVAQERLISTLAAFFGVLAVLLSCMGLYGSLTPSRDAPRKSASASPWVPRLPASFGWCSS